METKIIIRNEKEEVKGILSTDHSASSYGIPIVAIKNIPYGIADMILNFGNDYSIILDYSIEAQTIDFSKMFDNMAKSFEKTDTWKERLLIQAAKRAGYNIDMPESWFTEV